MSLLTFEAEIKFTRESAFKGITGN